MVGKGSLAHHQVLDPARAHIRRSGKFDPRHSSVHSTVANMKSAIQPRWNAHEFV